MSLKDSATTTITLSRDDIVRYGSFGLVALILVSSTVRYLYLAFTGQSRDPLSRYTHKNKKKPSEKTFQEKLNVIIPGLILVFSPAVVCVITAMILLSGAGETARTLFPPVRSKSVYTGAYDAMSALPLYPSNMTEAVLFGELRAELQHCKDTAAKNGVKTTKQKPGTKPGATSYDVCVAPLLQRAAEIAKRENVITIEHLDGVLEIARELDGSKGVVSRFFGAMSIINIIWLVAILGIALTLLPFVAFVAHPILKVAEIICTTLIVPVCMFMWHFLIVPFGGFLLYFISIWAFVESTRYKETSFSVAPIMVSILGVALNGCAWAFHTAKLERTGSGVSTYLSLLGAAHGSISAILAVAHQSVLLGYIAVIFVMVGLGFSAFSGGLFLMIGFDNRQQTLRAISACLTLNIIFSACRAAEIESKFLAPFESAVSIFGTAVYFLSLLIWCHIEDLLPLYVVNIVAHVVLGTALGNVGMTNCALTYGALFIFTVICNVSLRGNAIVGAFVSFVCLYLVASALAARPYLVAAALWGVDESSSSDQ